MQSIALELEPLLECGKAGQAHAREKRLSIPRQPRRRVRGARCVAEFDDVDGQAQAHALALGLERLADAPAGQDGPNAIEVDAQAVLSFGNAGIGPDQGAQAFARNPIALHRQECKGPARQGVGQVPSAFALTPMRCIEQVKHGLPGVAGGAN